MRTALREGRKVTRYAASFLRGGMVHTNFQPAWGCNFRCKICDFWHKKYQALPRMSAAQVEVVSEKLSHIGPQIVSIGGGEPLLHPEIVDVVRAAQGVSKNSRYGFFLPKDAEAL